MSAECDIARLVVKKVALQAELEDVRDQIKNQCKDVALPFAVTLDGNTVTVKPPPYFGYLPITSVIHLLETCDS